MLAGAADAAIIPSGIGGFIACKVRAARTRAPGAARIRLRTAPQKSLGEWGGQGMHAHTCVGGAVAPYRACPQALSKRNDEPHRASRPWDKQRDGFVMGEGSGALFCGGRAARRTEAWTWARNQAPGQGAEGSVLTRPVHMVHPCRSSGVLVLEELEHAKARGARIYAEYVGGDFSCDAHHMTEPHPEGKGEEAQRRTAHCPRLVRRLSGAGAARRGPQQCGVGCPAPCAGVVLCIERALKKAGLQASQVNYVNAHATSTQAGDMVRVQGRTPYCMLQHGHATAHVGDVPAGPLTCGCPRLCSPLPCYPQAEYRALAHVFPHEQLRINSTKSMIGHLLGGAGAVEAVATVKAITTGWLHPTINLEEPEPGVDLKRVCAGAAVQHQVDVALSNSFGFGGHNSCVLFKRVEPALA